MYEYRIKTDYLIYFDPQDKLREMVQGKKILKHNFGHGTKY
jgi:hypothetical protein